MGDVQTGSQQSSLTNPAMQAAGTTLGNQLNSALNRGISVDTTNRVPGLSGQTQQGVNSIFSAAGNTGGINAANSWATGMVGSGGYNDALRGAESGVRGYLAESAADAPGFAALKDRVATDVNSVFQGSGRFGSASHADDLASGLGALEYQNYSDRLGRQMAGNQALAGIGQTAMGNAAGAAGMLPSFYQAGLMPGQAMLGAGQIMDANAAARAQEEGRIWDQQNNRDWNGLQRGGAIFGGTAPVTGTTTNEAQPWWKVGLGLGSTVAGYL